MITNLIITLAIVIMAFSITLMSVRVKVTEEAVERFDFDKYSERMDAIDRDLDKCELAVNQWGGEVDEAIAKMEKITNDIARLDAQHEKDHRDLVDIRQRYVLYREPTQEEDNG